MYCGASLTSQGEGTCLALVGHHSSDGVTIKMPYHIDQLRTPSLPIGLVKTESGFIVRSVVTGLGRWTLVVAVISVDIHLFLAFSDLTSFFWLHPQPDSKETKFESRNQEASPSACKNTGVVLVPCSHMEVHPYNYFWWCGYFWGPWESIITTDEFSVKVTKIYFKDS